MPDVREMGEGRGGAPAAEEVFAEYLHRCARGEDVPFERVLSAHPHLADALRLLQSQSPRASPDATESPEIDGWLRDLIGSPGIQKQLGEYRIVRQVGRGGMGVVFEAEQLTLGRRVALKVLPPHALPDRAQVERFRREARAAGKLHHTNIVPIYGYGEDHGVHFYAMQYIEGSGLDRVIADLRAGLPGPGERFRTAAVIGLQVAGALAYAHSNGVLHRDIKPSNLILDAHGTVWIADFGLAKASGSEELTLSGDLLGTLRYMPPEQLEGRADERSDLYALGLTLYELLALRPAFPQSERGKLIESVLRDDPPRPSKLGFAVPVDLETIVLKTIEKEPARRYATAQDMEEDLRRFLAGEPIRARPLGAVGKAVRWARRRRTVAILGAAAGLALLGLLALGVWSTLRIRSERDVALAEEDWRRQALYAASLRLAHQAWEDGQAGLVIETLSGDGCMPSRRSQRDLRGWEWDYLLGLCRRSPLMVSDEKDKPKTCIAFSPDGSTIATGSDSGQVALWDFLSGREKARLRPAGGAIRAIAFHPRSRFLLSATDKGPIQVWDLKTGSPVREIGAGRTYLSLCLDVDGRRVAAGGWDGLVRVWDFDSGEERLSLAGHRFQVRHAAFSPDGKRLVSTGWDCTVRLWDAEDGALLRTMFGHRFFPSQAAFSPDGAALATGDEFNEIKLWDGRTGDLRSTLAANVVWVKALGFSPDGRWLAWGGQSNVVMLRDADGGEPLRLRGPLASVSGIAFSPDGRWLAASSLDGSLQTWEIPASAPEARVVPGSRVIVSIAFRPDGKELASACRYTGVSVWDPASGRRKRRLAGHQDEVTCVAYSPDGRLLASGGDDRTVRLWETETGREVRVLAFSYAVTSVAFSPDGLSLAAAGARSGVQVLDAGTGAAVRTYPMDGTFRHRVRYDPRGRWLAALCDLDHSVRLRNAATGAEERSLAGHGDKIDHFEFDRGGERIASASRDGTVRIWETSTGACLRTLAGHGSSVSNVQFLSADRVVSCGSDLNLKVWDIANGYETLNLKGHRSVPYALAVAPDGRSIASGGADDVIRLWELAAGEEERAAYRRQEREPAAMAKWHQRQAEDYLTGHLWQAAAFHLRRSLEIEPGEIRPAETQAAAGLARSRLAWAEGELCLAAGETEEACARFEAAAGEPADPRAVLELVSCLRKKGELGAAESRLRAALEGAAEPGADLDGLWDAWWEGATADLRRSAREILDTLPAGGAAGTGRAADLRWLLDRLTGEGLVVIDSGAAGDRFFLPQASPDIPLRFPVFVTDTRIHGEGPIHEEAVQIYRSLRRFWPAGEKVPAYRIPLPRGRWEVTLHFIEFNEGLPNPRVWHVLLEGRRRLEDVSPARRGMAVPLRSVLEVEVEDGFLDIGFEPVTGGAWIAGIEVRAARG